MTSLPRALAKLLATVPITVLGCGLLLLPACGTAPAPQTDAQRCDSACQKLTGCGVLYDSTCSAGCQQAPVFLGCIKQAADDCNALALCAFQQYAATFCAGSGGVPAGGASCNQTQACEGTCNAMGAPASCSCGCIAQMSAGRALNLLVNNQCSIARCATQCSPAGSGPACNACFAQMCQPQNAQCTAN